MSSSGAQWQKLDVRLIKIKLKKAWVLLAPEFRSEFRWEQLNPAPLPDRYDIEPARKQFIRLAYRLENKWLDTFQKTYGDVCAAQFNESTPQFWRDVFTFAVTPEIHRARPYFDETINRGLKLSKGMRGMFGLSDDEWEALSEQLSDHWYEQLEERALTSQPTQLATPIKAKPVIRKRDSVRPTEKTSIASKIRAKLVAQVFEELAHLKPDMTNPGRYDELNKKYPHYLCFKIAAKDVGLRDKVENLREHKQHMTLAQQLIASYKGKSDSTVKSDWKRYKPKRFRR